MTATLQPSPRCGQPREEAPEGSQAINTPGRERHSSASDSVHSHPRNTEQGCLAARARGASGGGARGRPRAPEDAPLRGGRREHGRAPSARAAPEAADSPCRRKTGSRGHAAVPADGQGQRAGGGAARRPGRVVVGPAPSDRLRRSRDPASRSLGARGVPHLRPEPAGGLRAPGEPRAERAHLCRRAPARPPHLWSLSPLRRRRGSPPAGPAAPRRAAWGGWAAAAPAGSPRRLAARVTEHAAWGPSARRGGRRGAAGEAGHREGRGHSGPRVPPRPPPAGGGERGGRASLSFPLFPR